jgi:Cdc6-like AAA superfamily ATPase
MGSEFQDTHMLNSDEICVNERHVIDLAESTDDARMVNLRNKNSQKVGQEKSVVLADRTSELCSNFIRSQ